MTAPAPTIAEIEDALDALLVAILADEARRRAAASTAGPPTFKLTSFAELCAGNPDAWLVEDLTRDPIGRACRAQVKALGKLLYRITGSTDVMHEVLERVAARDPAREGSRAVILDKHWNGIGAGDDRWWA